MLTGSHNNLYRKICVGKDTKFRTFTLFSFFSRDNVSFISMTLPLKLQKCEILRDYQILEGGLCFYPKLLLFFLVIYLIFFLVNVWISNKKFGNSRLIFFICFHILPSFSWIFIGKFYLFLDFFRKKDENFTSENSFTKDGIIINQFLNFILKIILMNIICFNVIESPP